MVSVTESFVKFLFTRTPLGMRISAREITGVRSFSVGDNRQTASGSPAGSEYPVTIVRKLGSVKNITGIFNCADLDKLFDDEEELNAPHVTSSGLLKRAPK